MCRGAKFLAIIPARSGSKGLKNKNIKELNGKPMIAYTIEEALKSNVFEDIVVATDSSEYADIALKYGAQVPFLRPEELSTDNATTRDCIVYYIEELERLGKVYDYIMILQPTSPLRTKEDIVGSVELMFMKNANAIISMCECDHPIEWSTHLKEEMCLDGLSEQFRGLRQEKSKSYRLNGAIYLSKIDYYMQNTDIYIKDSFAYIMDKEKSVDVDDIYDFKFAEMLIRERSNT